MRILSGRGRRRRTVFRVMSVGTDGLLFWVMMRRMLVLCSMGNGCTRAHHRDENCADR